MSIRSTASIQALHVTLVAAMLVPLVAMLAYTILVDSENFVAHEKAGVRALAAVTAADTGRTLTTHKEMLRAMAKRPLMRAMDPGHCDPLLAEFREFFPRFANFATVNSKGIAVCSAMPQPGGKPVSVANTEWFKRGMAEDRFLVGNPFLGPITGRWVSVLVYPVHNEADKLIGLLGLPLDLANYEANVSAAQLSPGTSVGILTGDGTVIWRNKEPEKWLGKTLRESGIGLTLLAARGGETEAVGLDGLRRYYTVVAVPEADWVVYASVPTDSIYQHAVAGAVRNSLLGLLVLAFVSVLASAIARRINRPIRSLAEAARGIRAGHTDIRAMVGGPPEVEVVAREFNQMVDERVAVEAALRESAREIEDLYNHAPCGYHSLDPQGTILRINDTELEWLGQRREEVVGRKRFMEFLGPASQELFKATFPSFIQSGQVRDVELDLVRNDGTLLPVLVSATAVRDSAGKILMSRTALYDISERKRTQQEIARTKELLERMFESIHVLVAYMDRNFNFIRVNRAYATADGRTPDFFPAKNHFALYPNAENEAIYRRVVQTREPYVAIEKPFEYAEHPERGVSYWDWRVEPVVGSTNEVEGIVLSLLDVTQRVQARLALEKSEEKFRLLSRQHQLILDSAGAGIYGVDLEGRCTFVNPAAAKMLGYAPEELIGQPLHEMFHHTRSDGSPYPATQCPVQRTREEGTSSRGSDEVYWRKDGSRFPVEYVSVPIMEDSRVVGAVASFLDITERKRLEQEKEQYLDFFKLSVNPMCIADPFGCFREVNPAFVKLTGYTEGELLTKPFLDFVLPEDREKTAREMELQVNVRESLHFENRYVCKDGAVILLSWTAYFDKDEGVTYATAQDITQSREAELTVARLNRALRTLTACNQMLIHATTESEILDSICKLIVDSGGYLMAWVGYAEHDAEQTVRPVAWAGHEEGYLTASKILWNDTELGRGPTGTAIRTSKSQVNQSVQADPALVPWREAALARGYQSITALPLKGAAGTFGALSIYASKHEDVSDAEVKLLEELADDLAFGIETLRMRAEHDRIAYEHSHHAEILRQSLLDTIKAIADTIGMRDPYTAGHQRRVSQLAVAIASELGMPEEAARVIGLAASIHDVGKIKVPAEILSKPARLHETEMMLVREHAQAGYEILKGIKFPWPIATIVGQHHERLDGSGYPRGLKDGEILLESQILAVADVVEAMASHRPYRPGLGIDASLREIEQGKGTLYGPVVAEACLKLFREGKFAFNA